MHDDTEVAIEYEGEISTGTVIAGNAAVGALATIELHDGNGVKCLQTGRVVEVF